MASLPKHCAVGIRGERAKSFLVYEVIFLSLIIIVAASLSYVVITNCVHRVFPPKSAPLPLHRSFIKLQHCSVHKSETDKKQSSPLPFSRECGEEGGSKMMQLEGGTGGVGEIHSVTRRRRMQRACALHTPAFSPRVHAVVLLSFLSSLLTPLRRCLLQVPPLVNEILLDEIRDPMRVAGSSKKN